MTNRVSALALGLMMAAGMALASGCGGLSSAQKADMGNVAGGMGTALQSGASGHLQESLTGEVGGSELRGVSAALHGAYWWARFAAEARATEARQQLLAGADTSGLTLGTTCPASTTAVTSKGISCTGSCNAAVTTINESCTIADGTTETCNGTAYTFTGATVGMALDFSGVTLTNSTLGGSATITVTLGANVTGGSLTGKALACTFTDTMSFSVTGASAPAVGCGNFTCTYGGSSISCADMQANTAAGTCK